MTRFELLRVVDRIGYINIWGYVDNLHTILDWCTDNLGLCQVVCPEGQWNLVDTAHKSVEPWAGDDTLINSIEFVDPEIATLVALKFGL